MAEGWPAAALKVRRASPAPDALVLDVEAAGIVHTAAPKPLNILHILRAPLGGLFRHVVDLVEGQAALGHRVGLIVDSTTGGARAEAALAALAAASGARRATRRDQPSARTFGPDRRPARLPTGSGKSLPTCCTVTAPRVRRWRG